MFYYNLILKFNSIKMAHKTIALTEENIAEHAHDIIAKMLEGFVPSVSKISSRTIIINQKQNTGEYDSWIYTNDYKFQGKLRKQLEAVLKPISGNKDHLGKPILRSSLHIGEGQFLGIPLF